MEIIQADDCPGIAVPEARAAFELLGALVAFGSGGPRNYLTRPSLESLFIKLTGKQLRE